MYERMHLAAEEALCLGSLRLTSLLVRFLCSVVSPPIAQAEEESGGGGGGEH